MIIRNYKPHDKGALVGFFEVTIPEFKNMTIFGCKHFVSGEKSWVGLPSREVAGKEGEQSKFWPYIRFQSREEAERILGQILGAVNVFVAKMAAEVPKESKEAPSYAPPF